MQKIVRVKLQADTKAYKREMRKSARSVNAFGNQVKKIGGMLAGAFAVSSVVSFASASVKAYDVQAKAEAELLTALKGRKSAQQDLINQAQQLQKTTLFGDEETIHAQALIAAFVKEKDQIKQIIPLVQDFATAKKMNLAAAADLVSKTLGSTTNALTRYGIKVEGAVGSNERLQSTIQGLSRAFKGQAETAAQAGAGGLKQLANLWGDLKESIGGVIYQGIKPFVGTLKDLLSPSEDLVKNLKDQQDEANLLAIQLTNTNLKEEERRKILTKLNAISPDIVKGLDAENLSIVTLKENLKKFNDEYVKKIAIQENEDKVTGARKNLGKAITDRIQREIDLEKSMLEIKKHVGTYNKEEAKQMGDVLMSTDSLEKKFQDIQQIDNKFRKAGAKGVYFGHVADAMAAVVQSRLKETKLQGELNDKIKEYENVYRKIYGLAADSKILTKSQRDKIDNYNRLTGASLDYSKALTKEQEAELAKLNQGKKTVVNLQKMQDEVGKLKTKRDALAKKALVNPNAVPQSAIDQINALDKQISELEKKIKAVKDLTPPTRNETPITPMQPLSGPTNIATEITPNINVKPNYTFDNSSLTDFQKTFKAEWANAMQGMQMALAGLFSDLANMIGEDIGNLLSGVPVDFGKDFLAMMGGFIKQLGKLMIEFGSIMLAFSILKNNPNPITAIAAIAVGTAAVAVGTVLTNTVKDKAPGMIEGGVVPPGYPNDGYNARLTSGEIVVPPKKLEVFLSEISKKQESQNKNITNNSASSVFNNEIVKYFKEILNKNIINNPVSSVFNNKISKNQNEIQNKNITNNSASTFFNSMLQKMSLPNLTSKMSLAMPSTQNLKLNAIPVDVKISGTFRQNGDDLVAVVEQTQVNRTRMRGY